MVDSVLLYKQLHNLIINKIVFTYSIEKSKEE